MIEVQPPIPDSPGQGSSGPEQAASAKGSSLAHGFEVLQPKGEELLERIGQLFQGMAESAKGSEDQLEKSQITAEQLKEAVGEDQAAEAERNAASPDDYIPLYAQVLQQQLIETEESDETEEVEEDEEEDEEEKGDDKQKNKDN